MSFYSPYIPFTSYNMTTSLQHLSLTEGKLHKKRWYSEIYQHVFFVCVCLLIKTTFLLQSLTHFIHPSSTEVLKVNRTVFIFLCKYKYKKESLLGNPFSYFIFHEIKITISHGHGHYFIRNI